MRDLADTLGDPTESLTAEALMNYRLVNQANPTWADLATEMVDLFDMDPDEVDPRMMCAWHCGEVITTLNDDFDVEFRIARDTERRLAARYAYLRLLLAAERPSPQADDIIAEGSIDDFQDAYGRPVVDWLVEDLDITPAEALRILLAEKDEYSDAIRGETLTLAGTLHRFLRDHQSA